jgi:D-alanyl-D-alanine carboxypeptidase (penicillin-binding protein 5/6)
MKRTKILFSFFIFIIFCNFLSFSFALTLAEKTAELESLLTSQATLIMEASTGRVVYEHNGYQKKYPASTTKMLTAILAIEHCNLNETATASETAIKSIPGGYSTANIQIGETLCVEDLLYALMLQSANESAVILAEHISGSHEAFAELMNKKLEEIGCKNTHFVNSNGIHNENHYSTAYDLALIAQYCMKNETFRKIVREPSFTLPATSAYPAETRTFTNTNNLLIYDGRNRPDNYYYEYATGIKTGYTTPAKNCLVSSATKNGMDYICVVLGADVIYGNSGSISARYTDTISLFNYAFDNFSFRKIKSANSNVKTIEIENATKDTKKLDLLVADEINVLASIDNKDTEIEPKIVLNDNLIAPISKGSVVGHISYEVEGLCYTTDLLASNDVKEAKSTTFILVVFIILFVCAVVIWGFRYYNLNYKKYRRRYSKIKRG